MDNRSNNGRSSTKRLNKFLGRKETPNETVHAIRDPHSFVSSSRSESENRSVDQIIDDIGTGKHQIACLVVLSILALADGVEVMTLSILNPYLRCDWLITLTEGAMLVCVVLIGMIFGSVILSNFSDIYGRKPISILICVATFYYGLMSALVPNMGWLYVWRGLLGISLGGMPIVLSAYLMEFLPRTFRAKAQALMFTMWGIGSIVTAIFGSLVVPAYGWRILLGITALPALFGIIPLILIDESPRFLLLKGYTERVKDVLVRMAKRNNHPLRKKDIHLEEISESSERGNLLLLFHQKVLSLTIPLFVLWLSAGLMFFGAMFLSTELPLTTYRCLQDKSRLFNSSSLNTDDSCCSSMSRQFYISIMVAALGDTLAAVMNFFLLDWIGRKLGMCVFTTISALLFVFLDLCIPVPWRSILHLALRCFTLAFYNTLFIYTAEVYPTSIRSSSLGACGMFMKLGVLITPFLAEVLIKYNVRLTLLAFSSISLIASVFSLILPKETVHAGLAQETGEEKDEPSHKSSLLDTWKKPKYSG